MQTKQGSIIESIINTFIGFLLNLICSPLIYWICDVKISISQLWWVTIIFTLVSILRGYVIRRFFNNIIIKRYGSKNNL